MVQRRSWGLAENDLVYFGMCQTTRRRISKIYSHGDAGQFLCVRCPLEGRVLPIMAYIRRGVSAQKGCLFQPSSIQNYMDFTCLKYRKNSCISRTFLPKFWVKNRGCGIWIGHYAISVYKGYHYENFSDVTTSYRYWHCAWPSTPRFSLIPQIKKNHRRLNSKVFDRRKCLTSTSTGDYMAWGSISLFAGFLEKENSLETLIVIFENVSSKGFFWLNMITFSIMVVIIPLVATTTSFICMTIQAHTVLQKLCLGIKITTQGNYVTLIIICHEHQNKLKYILWIVYW